MENKKDEEGEPMNREGGAWQQQCEGGLKRWRRVEGGPAMAAR